MCTRFLKTDSIFAVKDMPVVSFIVYLTEGPEKVKPWQGCQSLTHLMKNIPITNVIQFLIKLC